VCGSVDGVDGVDIALKPKCRWDVDGTEDIALNTGVKKEG